ncbi:hypothetical protein SAMN06298216_2121 [Spirosomataceae bacterium TFI 002]|nr:hypothetical protein SAMN06298216_2121 [Spirosomataceae bacterium TFI 002]
MITKERLHEHIDKLPDEMTIEEAIEKLLFISKLEERIQEADRNETVTYKEAEKQLSKWLK